MSKISPRAKKVKRSAEKNKNPPSRAGDTPPERVTKVTKVTRKKEGFPPTRSVVYCEPVARYEDGELLIEFVGDDTSDDHQALEDCLSEMGTPGLSYHPGMVLLPSDEAEYGDVNRLLRQTISFINRYCELPPGMDVVVAYYILLTWLYDAFDEVPYLRFRHPAHGVGKSRALQVVGSLCRRPILVSGASTPASIRRIVDVCQGTLLIDEGDLDSNNPSHSSLTKMLLTGFQRGTLIIVNEPTSGSGWKPRGFDPYGPKLVAHHERFRNPALESRFIDCLMVPRTRKDVPLNLPRKKFDQQALALRNQLLAFRRDNLRNVRINRAFVRPELDDRTNQIALPLLSLADDPEHREIITDALATTQKRLTDDIRGTELGQVAMELLTQGKKRRQMLIKELARKLDTQPGFGNRQIADAVRRLGLTVKHTKYGSAMILDDNARAQLRTFVGSTPLVSPSPSSPSSPRKKRKKGS